MIKLLERNLKLTEENNKILRKMHRAALWKNFFSVLYWVFIVGTALGAYYFLQPYVGTLQGMLGSLKGNVETVKTINGAIQTIGSTLPQK